MRNLTKSYVQSLKKVNKHQAILESEPLRNYLGINEHKNMKLREYICFENF